MKDQFCVLSEELANKINQGIITEGFMVRDLKDRIEDRVFFENEEEAKNYMMKIHKADCTRTGIIMFQVKLNKRN